ncbi:acetyl-CoA carboxylase carboxyl transferase subunit beta [Candidatus Poribacteria bacterium]|nr:acetyl-CoA carboxylase carboxyl transferase subunit beta [Candidatus Poribacteria bacterium]
MAIPESMTCRSCQEQISKQEFLEAYKVCPKCNYHHYINAYERLKLLVDADSFREHDAGLYSLNPLDFPDYGAKLAEDYAKGGLKSEILAGEARIGGYLTAVAIGDLGVRGGAYGSVMGEKLTRCIERATEKRLPLITVSISGGMRMQEGTIALMQMVKTAAACVRHAQAGLFYISVMTDPTFGGTTASFASLAHIILAEPGARIGFAGPLATASIRQKLPDNFQKAEFLLEHGLIDRIVPRNEMRSLLIHLLDFGSNKTD